MWTAFRLGGRGPTLAAIARDRFRGSLINVLHEETHDSVEVVFLGRRNRPMPAVGLRGGFLHWRESDSGGGRGDGLEILAKRDGSFVRVATDPCGRRPFYYARLGRGGFVGSSIPIVPSFLIERPRWDAMAAAEQLLFNVPVAGHTLVEQVRALPPGRRLTFGASDNSLSIEPRAALEFSHGESGETAVQADTLHAAIHGAVRDDADNDGAAELLLLSGGSDSWLVARHLQEAGVRPLAVSFRDPIGRGWREAVVAEKRAKRLTFPFRRLEADRASAEEERTVLLLGGGQHSLGFADRAALLHRLSTEEPNRSSVWTGDTGLYRRPMAPGWVKDETSARQWLLGRGGSFLYAPLFTLEESASVAGVSAAALWDRIFSTIVEYPEEHLPGKLTHFVIDQYVFCLQSLGQQLTRLFFRPKIPLEAPRVWRLASRLTQAQRASEGLEAAMRDPTATAAGHPGLHPTARYRVQDLLLRSGRGLPSWDKTDLGGELDEPLSDYFRRRMLDTMRAAGTELRVDVGPGYAAKPIVENPPRAIVTASGRPT